MFRIFTRLGYAHCLLWIKENETLQVKSDQAKFNRRFIYGKNPYPIYIIYVLMQIDFTLDGIRNSSVTMVTPVPR
jgi:hypothetical protein